MFRVVQYVERQVVLYDSVEDAAFTHLNNYGTDLSIKDFVNISESKTNLNEIADKLSEFSARIVFTAHPTQFYPPSVLDIISKLRRLIQENNIDEIDLTLQQLGLTSLMNREKPTPFDEAKNLIYFLKNVYYDATGELFTYIKNSLKNKHFDNHDIIKLGFWPGGDRDGNPYVTSDITMNVADELRMSLMDCYYKDVENLRHKLTFQDVQGAMRRLSGELYKSLFDASEVVYYGDILESLTAVRNSVINNYNSLYLDEIDSLIDKVNIFKSHFASLDIRQNHSVHRKTIEAILHKEGLIRDSLDELKEEELVEILLEKDLTVDAEHYDDPLISDTIQTISQIQVIQRKNGEEGCNRYVISNSEDIFSVLFVYALFRWCGLGSKNIPIDIIPLFESMEAMKNAGSIMKYLFELQKYRKHLQNRNEKQTIMLGFSDGTKDGGYLKANWSIFRTKEKLTEVCDQYNIKAIFFDGRGGPPARGGGKTHRFYSAQTQNIANHEIQMTIQGQTITSKYGTKAHFKYNSEQLLTAALHNTFNTENAIRSDERELIERLAQISYERYNALKNHEKFLPYLEKKSTLKYYGAANIGSRPAKRGGSKKLNLSDLRAISYVGSWSQLKQNVPGFFGIGTAVKTLVDEGKLNELKRLFTNVPFFKALILNSMMSLSKCYFELTSYMGREGEFKDFWNMLYEEYKLSKEMVLLISGYEKLMEEEAVTKNSIEIREKIVLPLLVIQQYALQKIESESGYKEIYEKIVKRSMYGNINASRNSA
jgi:phosphoenolpyruvate carboxylase